MAVGTVSMCLVIVPLAIVDVTVGVDQLAVAVSLIVAPLSIVLTAVLPDLLTVAVLHAVEQLARVDGTVREGDWSITLPLVVVQHLGGDATCTVDYAVLRIVVILHDRAGTATLEVVLVHHL